MVMKFGMAKQVVHTDLLTENEHILPCSSRDSPILTCLKTIAKSNTVAMHDDITCSCDLIAHVASCVTSVTLVGPCTPQNWILDIAKKLGILII